MKFPVIDKESKIALIILLPIALAIWIGIDIVLAVKAIFDSVITKIALLGMSHLFTVLTLVITIYLFVYEYATVTIDEHGVTLKRGRMILKHFEWCDVKRLEKMGARRRGDVIIIILTQHEPTRSFRKAHCMLEVVGRHHIMLLYSGKALKEIWKYCDVPLNVCEI